MSDDAPGMTSIASWTADQVRAIAPGSGGVAPLIRDGDFKRVSPELDVWDAWPVQTADGEPANVGEGITLWMALAAPHRRDPEERHGLARIHLFQRDSQGWRHLGQALPEGFSPGSREWSGSAVLAENGRELTLYFTATGQRGETELTFTQRLFSARATLEQGDRNYRLVDWRDLAEVVSLNPAWYMASDAGTPGVGTIKAFRDPAYFRDPHAGGDYLFFAGSLAGSPSSFNGVIGAAVSAGPAKTWTLLPPILSADGLNNELERPHAIMHGGLYYLFWSTQSHVFNPQSSIGPTGLYGMVSDHIDSDWRPLNGTGLVFANPPEAPRQAYSWLVLPDRSVISFVDDWGQGDGALPRRFGASFAPILKLRLDGDEAALDL